MNTAHRNLMRSLAPAWLLLAAVACQSIVDLNETPTTFVDPATYFKTGDQAIAAINGAYQPMMTWDDWISPASQEVTCEEPDIHCPGWWAWGQLGAHTGAWFAGRTWTSNYAVIRRANDVLAQLDKVTLEQPLKERLAGEAQFLRGYAYFELVRRYGGVPLRLTPYTPDGTFGDAPRAAVADVYKAIAADLKSASTLLPSDYISKTYTSADKGRPTKYSALGLLSKVYLHMAGAEVTGLDKAAYNDSARIAALAVKQSGAVQLEADFMKNFDWQRQIDSREILWQVGGAHIENTGMELTGYNPPDYKTVGGGGGGWVQMRQAFYETYEPNDFRVKPGYAIYDFWRESYSSSDPGTPTWFASSVPDSIATQTGWQNQVGWTWTDLGEIQGANKFKLANNAIVGIAPRVFTLKWTDRTALTKSQNGNSAVILRYADVLLILAEAENEKNGPTPLAYEAINLVRDRAGLPPLETAKPGLDKAGFRDAVWLERRHELYNEFQTWFDLKREGIWLEIMNNDIAPYPGSSTPNAATQRPREEYQKLLPLPSDELGANRLIKQNPGY